MDYTQPDPPAGGDQPDAGSTPDYAPPPAQGPPPSQQPYQPAGGYQAAPPPPPPKKGFNWLACCGISCVVLLIIGGIVGYCSYRFMQPFIGIAVQMESISARVQETDLATIKSSAIEVTGAELANNPQSYVGQWLELEGVIASASSTSNTTFSFGDFSTEETTNYPLASGIVVMDVTKAPPVGGPGDEIVAYGQCYTWDMMEMGKMPFIGEAIKEEIKNDPALQGQTAFTLMIAKDVSLAVRQPVDTMDEDGGTSGDGTDGASGWMK